VVGRGSRGQMDRRAGWHKVAERKCSARRRALGGSCTGSDGARLRDQTPRRGPGPKRGPGRFEKNGTVGAPSRFRPPAREDSDLPRVKKGQRLCAAATLSTETRGGRAGCRSRLGLKGQEKAGLPRRGAVLKPASVTANGKNGGVGTKKPVQEMFVCIGIRVRGAESQ